MAKNNKLRKAKVENKYNLTPALIPKLRIFNTDAIHKAPFWRNDVVSAWCLSGGTGSGFFGDCEDEYWIGFYDETAPAYTGKIRFSCTSMEGMCGYKFTKFFDMKQIESIADLELHEAIVSRLNQLIDDGVLGMPEN